MAPILRYLLKLSSEGSTYAGISGALGGMMAFGLSTEIWTQVFGVVATVSGLAASITLDNSHRKELAESQDQHE
jgi:hypothetical protein